MPEGSNFDNPFFFSFLMREERIQIPLQEGHHLMAFRWRVDVGPTLKAGLVVLLFLRGPGPGNIVK